jgi:hypothetical protein
MSTYETAPATVALATRCICCGRPLLDAVSVETGVGPECRKKHGYASPDVAIDLADVLASVAAGCGGDAALFERLTAGWGVAPEARTVANRAVYALATQAETKETEIRLLNVVYALGFRKLAAKIADRAGAIVVSPDADGRLAVETPYSPDFNAALRNAGVGAKWEKERKVWTTSAAPEAKRKLYGVLRATFAGSPLLSPKGITLIAA